MVQVERFCFRNAKVHPVFPVCSVMYEARPVGKPEHFWRWAKEQNSILVAAKVARTRMSRCQISSVFFFLSQSNTKWGKSLPCCQVKRLLKRMLFFGSFNSMEGRRLRGRFLSLMEDRFSLSRKQSIIAINRMWQNIKISRMRRRDTGWESSLRCECVGRKTRFVQSSKTVTTRATKKRSWLIGNAKRTFSIVKSVCGWLTLAQRFLMDVREVLSGDFS